MDEASLEAHLKEGLRLAAAPDASPGNSPEIDDSRWDKRAEPPVEVPLLFGDLQAKRSDPILTGANQFEYTKWKPEQESDPGPESQREQESGEQELEGDSEPESQRIDLNYDSSDVEPDSWNRKQSDPDEHPAKYPATVRKRNRLHPAAYVLIALAFGFGVTAAIVVFSGRNVPDPAPAVTQDAVKTPPVVPAASSAADPPADATASAASDSGQESKSGGDVKPAAKPPLGKDLPAQGTAPAKSAEIPKVGLAGPTINGPSVGGGSAGAGAGTSAGSVPLDKADIERVVNSQRAAVNRACWEPASASGDPNTQKSARVVLSLWIDPSGAVSGASASGGEAYPGLASCVAGKAKGWRFPSSSATSTAKIPFVFASQ